MPFNQAECSQAGGDRRREQSDASSGNPFFFKSSRSSSGACVEVGLTEPNAEGERFVVARDSKEGGKGPELLFTPREWAAFVEGTKDGEFDIAALEARFPLGKGAPIPERYADMPLMSP